MADTKKRSYNKGKSNYHAHSQKKKKILSLEPGMKGFFCTCNFQEKNCIREAYNLLNEYADKLYGPEEGNVASDLPVDDKTPENEEPDICDDLEKQIADIKCSGHKLKRFQSVQTFVPNCIFIKADVDEPTKLGSAIVEDIALTKLQKTRYLLRLVPIEATCNTKIEEIISTAGQLFDKHFLGEPTTFSIVFNRRYNNSLSRDLVIKELADLITQKNNSHKADLTKPKLSVIVEIIKGNCLLSVVADYYLFKKYNLYELCVNPEDKNKTDDDKAEGDDPEVKDELEDVNAEDKGEGDAKASPQEAVSAETTVTE